MHNEDEKVTEQVSEGSFVYDSLGELRYKSPPKVEPRPKYNPKKVSVSVYKVDKFWHLRDIRSFTLTNTVSSCRMTASTKGSNKYLLSNSNPLSQHDFLSPTIIKPECLTLSKNLKLDHCNPQTTVCIRKPSQEDEYDRVQLSERFKRESNSLQLHRKKKLEQLQQENDVMKKSGKDREHLLMRRHQVMPKIGTKNLEKTTVPIQRSVSPIKFPDWVLWAPVIYDLKEKNGLMPQLKKSQRGYDVVTDWVGHPEITDEVRKELSLNEEHARSTLVQNDNEHVCSERMECRCLPAFQRLGVIGIDYESIQQTLEEPIRKLVILDNETQAQSDMKTCRETEQQAKESSAEERKSSRVSLVLGGVHLRWSTDPQKSNETHVAELGCSAEPKKHSIDYVLMKNTGTTVIRFNWVKKTARVTNGPMRMIFDSCEGIILPGEVYRIPFMYKALSPGQFCEDWKLLTQPVLENGAEIILRLWGFTRHDDKQLSARVKIEDDLHRRMVVSIAKRVVDELIENLPIGQMGSCDEVLPDCQEIRGPAVFLCNNPWLYYNSYHVDRIGKIANYIVAESKKLYTSKMQNVTQQDMESSMSTATIVEEDLGPRSNASENFDIGETHHESQPNVMESSTHESLSSIEEECESLSGEVFNLRNQLFNYEPVQIPETPVKIDVQPKKEARPVLVDESNIEPEEGEEEMENDLHSENPEEALDAETPRNEGTTPACKPIQSMVNTVDPNIVVNNIREDLVHLKTNVLKQDALFTILSEEISCLLFRQFDPYENWKIAVVKGLFIKAIDQFEMFATSLENVCYEAEYLEQAMKKKEAEQAERLTSLESESDDGQQVLPQEADHREDSPEDEGPCLPFPRYDLTPERFKDQYCGRLYSTMFWLLSDMIDQMDFLIYQPPSIDPRYGKEAFIKVNRVPLNVNIESELEKPLPPRWIAILHKMNEIRNELSARRARDKNSVTTSQSDTANHPE